MKWFIEKQFIRDRAARALSNLIDLDEAYQTLASSCFNVMFKRAERYPDHVDHTVENLVARVKKFCAERRKAIESEKKFNENPAYSFIIALWPSRLRKCEYSYSRYNELQQKLNEMGVMRFNYEDRFFFYYTNLVEESIEMEEVIARVLLQEAISNIMDYGEISSVSYEDLEDDYTQKIFEKKYGENLSWLEAAEIVIEELNDDHTSDMSAEDEDPFFLDDAVYDDLF